MGDNLVYKINIVCVGKLKEKFFISAQEEYLKRLSRFCEIKVTELNEFLLPQDPSQTQIENALDKEYNQMQQYLKGKVFVCDSRGSQYISEDFSSLIFKSFENFDTITFVIGSSYGLSKKIKEGNSLISFSKMTFPHHLMRVFLQEQIYRAFCIKNNITYHK